MNFTFYKETAEGVCHMRVSQLLQREWELKAFGILKEVSYLLQGQGETEGVCYQGFSHVWVFVVREMHLFQGQKEQKVCVVNECHFCYKTTMEDVCYMRVSQLLQREWEWNKFGIRQCHICYKDRGKQKVFVVREFHMCGYLL